MLSGSTGILIQVREILKCDVQQYRHIVKTNNPCLNRQFMQLGFMNAVLF